MFPKEVFCENMAIISLKLELLNPTKSKQGMYEKMTEINTGFSNWLLGLTSLSKITSKIFKDFSDERFPSAIVNQTIREVNSKKKHQKATLFKKFWCGFNNQNCKIELENNLYKFSFPTLKKRIAVPVVAKDYQQYWLDKLLSGKAKQGKTELYKKRGRWFVAVAISFETEKLKIVSLHPKIMGIDVGLRNIATCSLGTKNLIFKGNGVSFKRRKFASKRKKLGQLKKLSAIKRSKNKESRWMKDVNHKISRQIIHFAISNGVGVIRMEDLTGIRMAKSKKEAGRNLHHWSFYQLQKFIEYKADMKGIKVDYVKPAYTSQTCKCGHCHKDNRHYLNFKCKKCGYKNHADVNASINIAKAISGFSETKNKTKTSA